MSQKFSSRWIVTHLLTERCNLNCRMCFQSNIRKKKNVELSFDDIISFYKKHRNDILVVNITGGEPFIRSDCIDIIETLDSFGFFITINTNATLITSEIAERLVHLKHLRSITISVDGPGPIHNGIRRKPNAFEKTLDSIKLFHKLGISHRIQINTMILPEIMDFLENHVNYFSDFNIDNFEFIFPGSYSKEELSVSQNILDVSGLSDIVIDTAENAEFINLSPADADKLSTILRKFPTKKITIVPNSFIKNPFLFLDQNPYNSTITCKKFNRKEIRINSAGQVVFCDTLRKPIRDCLEICSLNDFKSNPDLLKIKQAVEQGLPCCKRCCKSSNLKIKQSSSNKLEQSNAT